MMIISQYQKERKGGRGDEGLRNGSIALTLITLLYLASQVGDNQSLLQSLKDSPYYKSFEDKASVWEQRLADLDEYLHNLNQIQRKWVYLEPIFGRGALPKEQGRFKRVDDDYRLEGYIY